MFITTLIIAIIILSLCLLAVLYRFIKGPTLPDRVTAFDLFSACVIGIVAVFAILTGNAAFLDVAIVLSLIAFLGSMSFAYYLTKKVRK